MRHRQWQHHYITWYYITWQYHITSLHHMWHYITWHYITWHHITLHHITWQYHITSHHYIMYIHHMITHIIISVTLHHMTHHIITSCDLHHMTLHHRHHYITWHHYIIYITISLLHHDIRHCAHHTSRYITTTPLHHNGFCTTGIPDKMWSSCQHFRHQLPQWILQTKHYVSTLTLTLVTWPLTFELWTYNEVGTDSLWSAGCDVSTGGEGCAAMSTAGTSRLRLKTVATLWKWRGDIKGEVVGI